MRLPIATLLLALSSSVAAFAAPDTQPVILRGIVTNVAPSSLTIKTDAGATVTAGVTGKSSFATVEKRMFSQLKPTDFIGVTAVPGKNGHLRAEEVHVLPVTGLGEGQYPWNHRVTAKAVPSGLGSMTNSSISATHSAPMMAGSMTNGSITAAHGAPMMGGSMTNGTVTAGGGAHELNVSYHGAEIENGKCEGRAVPGKPGCVGTSVIDVPPDAPIVAVVPGSRADVKPGLRIVAFVADDAAGHPVVSRATVEKNGVKPEF